MAFFSDSVLTPSLLFLTDQDLARPCTSLHKLLVLNGPALSAVIQWASLESANKIHASSPLYLERYLDEGTSDCISCLVIEG